MFCRTFHFYFVYFFRLPKAKYLGALWARCPGAFIPAAVRRLEGIAAQRRYVES